jgi:multidrug efflux pump subunit AcrA (membrane-fusion protein)
VAVDGVRVRASAGSDSFRRAATLETHLHDARQQLDRLKAELELTPNELSQRQQKARQRGLRERQERLQRALKNLEDISASREKRQAGSGEDARASSTDPECRKMKMADGGYRPAYNVQLGTDVDSGIIVGAHVSNAGTDAHELQPMLEQIKTNTGKTPTHTLADGGYFSSANINQAAGEGTTLYLPLKCEKQQLEQGKDPYAPKRGDSPAEKQVRQRMKEPASKELYKLRGQSAEWANAQLRNRGLQQFRVRGLVKTCTMVIWFVLAHNLLQAHRLRAEKTKAKAT